jgi:16S rRNA (cytosine967-C5)-methyltransferase
VAQGAWLENSLTKRTALLTGENLALARALVYAVLRHQARLDFLIKGKLKKGGASSALMAILRLGLAQFLFFNRLGDHAIVYETVKLASDQSPGLKGLINAILRGFAREKAKEGFIAEVDGRDTAPLDRLAVFYSHPRWLVDLFVSQLGLRETRSLLVANNQLTPPTLRVNPKLISRRELAANLPFATKETKYSPWGLRPLKWPGNPENWPGYAEGHFAIQDEASQILGLLVGQPKRVLDACAGLGGKTLALASSLAAETQLVALDPQESRLGHLLTEAKRQKAGQGINVVQGRIESVALAALNQGPGAADLEAAALFDLVIVDAPCSGLGVIRRRPDIKWRKTLSGLGPLAASQGRILQAAAKLVAPGGRLIYSVCSVTEAEGPKVMEWFLKNTPNFGPLTDPTPPALAGLEVGVGQLRLWPQRDMTDGFFYGLLTRLA